MTESVPETDTTARRPDGLLHISPGVFVTAVDDAVVVFDAVAQQAHVLSGVEAWVITSPQGTTAAELVANLARDMEATEEDAAPVIDATLQELDGLGLVGRTEPFDTPPPVVSTITGPEEGWHVGATHEYLDQRLAYCGPDAELIETIDTFLGAGSKDDPTVYFSVRQDTDGRIEVRDDSIIHFSSTDQMLWQLPSELNLAIARTDSMPVLHAGAVRTPDGHVVAVTGPINTGKSTLIAALIAAGCDYASDESIGISPDDRTAWGYPKPLTLSPISQRLVGVEPPEHLPSPREHRRADAIRAGASSLGGWVGPVDLIIHTVYDPEAEPSVEQLDPPAALRMLLTNCLNPVRGGQVGLDTLARLAKRVPVLHITHGNSVALADTVIAASADPGRISESLDSGLGEP